jgi:spore germination protein GerM
VYLVDGPRLVPVRRAGDGSPGAALAALVAGPTMTEAERGLRSAVAPGTSVRVTRRSGDLVVVDLSKELTESEPGEQVLAVGQLVCTATAAGGVGRVAFTLQGRPIDAPGGDGRLRTRPLARADFEALLRRP